MKRSLLCFMLSFAAYFAFGQCGPYRMSASCSNTATISGASGAAQIVWQRNGITLDTMRRGGRGTTVAGGNGYGLAANQINPTGLWFDASGNMYVSDQNGNRIQKFPPGSTSATNGVTVAGGNGADSGANQLNQPASVFVDGSGNVYIPDLGNNRIQKFPAGSTSATNGITIAGGNGGGSASNQLSAPQSVFVDGSGNMYVADFGNNRILKFPSGSSSATNGTIVAGGNGAGSAANQLNQPVSVYVDGSGNIYVADLGNSRIQKFPAGSSSATSAATVAGGNGSGNAANQLNYPGSIFVDGSGNLYIADMLNNRIQKFPAGSTSATNGVTVAGNGSSGTASVLAGPSGVYVNSAGSIYIADYLYNRIQKWTQPADLGIDTFLSVNSAGSYSAVITDTSGCVTTSDTVIDNLNFGSSIYQNICPGGSYTFAGHVLTTPGTYFDTLTSVAGCDSIVTLQLINGAWNNNIYQSICQGSSYSFAGLNLVATGIYYDSLTSSIGCDSIIALHLTVTPNGPYTLTAQEASCSSFVLNLTGASGASHIVWKENGLVFDSASRGLQGPVTTVAGGNGPGGNNNQMGPTAVFVDRSGYLYVADAARSRILKFPPNSTSATNGIVVAGGNGNGSLPNQFNEPTGIYVDSAGYIYVADLTNARIQKFPPNSTSATNGVTVMSGGPLGTLFSSSSTSSVFIDHTGTIFATQPGNNMVIRYDSIGIYNNETVVANYQLSDPNAVYVDRSGYIYVADVINQRIQRFPPGSTSTTAGVTIAGGIVPGGSGADQLNSPMGVWGDDYGNIYVLDAGNNRVQKFAPGSTTGSIGITVAGGNGPGSAANQINLPSLSFYTGMYVDGQGNVYIADLNNNRIQKWSNSPVTGIDTSAFGPSSGSYSAIVTNAGGCVASSDTISAHASIAASFNIQPSSTPHLWYVVNQCTGAGALSYTWNWGDGSSGSGATPTHTYNTAGYYNICVTVTDSLGCTDNYCDTNVYLYKDQAGQMIYINVVSQIPNGINSISADNLSINYYGGAVHFSETLSGPSELELYDLSGRVVQSQNNFTGNKWDINPGIVQGVYIIHLQNDGNSISQKLLIVQ